MRRILRFRVINKDIFSAIKSGKKKVETRAASKRYKDIEEGDILVFVCGKEKFEKKVKEIFYSKTVLGLLKKYSIKDIRPDLKTKIEFLTSYDSFPGYSEKLKQFGIIAFKV